jgi:RNA polymerase sigma factor (sigma-70 family)
MGMTEDAELLRQYTETSSEDAFTELVRRYLPLVYSAALRQVRGDQSLAKDVAQTVFVDLARKAKSLAGRELLGGWLYNSTRLAAYNIIRVNQRRIIREQKAVAMQETPEDSAPEESSEDLKLVLDEAMSKLDSVERNAVLLRFFQGKDLKEVGAALGVTEDAARMRVNRSLGKLHTLLTRRGVTLSAAALGVALTTETISAVPAGMVVSIAEGALVGAASGTGTTIAITKVLTMTKLKIGIASIIVAAGVATPLALQHNSQAKLRVENQALQSQIAELEATAAERQRVADLQVRRSETQSLADNQLRELMKLRREVAQLRADANELENLKAAHARLTDNPVVQKALKTEVRVAKLKQLIKDKPNLVIPEFYLLGEGELRRAANDFDLETEDGIRAAFASLRFRAENNFAVNLQPALKKYADSHDGQPPENVQELASYFEPPLDPALLARYKVVRFDPKLVKGGWSGGWVVSQAEPVDGIDMRWDISPVGFGPGRFEMTNEVSRAH